jgi:predicted type IV restriction endonuclease
MLKDHIRAIQDGIKAGYFTNQASVSQGIVLRILQVLSWPTFDIKIVSPEYPLNGRRVDFALCHPQGKPKILIEVKPPGQSATGERQLFEYAFHRGVPMAILTDGQEWHFFLPGEPGDYGERRVYRLDIVEREIEESVKRLKRYLGYEAVCSGAALEAARADYQDVARQRTIQATLPNAFKKLVEDEEELLLELIADQVENLCGYKPDLDTVSDYLRGNVNISSSRPPKFIAPLVHVTPQKPLSGPTENIGFNLHGRWYSARNARDVFVKIFLKLDEQDSTFLERFASLPRHGRKRRYLAKNPNKLYPHRPDLVQHHSIEFKNGWWLGVNVSKNTIGRIIKMACDVAKIKYGTEVTINLGN